MCYFPQHKQKYESKTTTKKEGKGKKKKVVLSFPLSISYKPTYCILFSGLMDSPIINIPLTQ